MFTELTINNFKNFKHLEVKDIKLVNTISGFNQSGKTTFLEAIACIGGLYLPHLLYQKNLNWRDFDIRSADEVLYLFHNLQDANNPISLTATYDNIQRIINVKLIRQEPLCSLSFEHHLGKKMMVSNVQLSLQPQASGSYWINNHTFDESTLAHNIPCRLVNNNTAKIDHTFCVSKLLSDAKREELLSFLNNVLNDKIKDIFINYRCEVHVLKNNVAKSIPTSLLGDGFKKIAALFSMFFTGDKVILIDEIENGLHHSLHKKVIASIFKYAHKKHIQVFIATHNQEILTTINEVLTEHQEYQQDYSHYMLANTTKGNKAYRLNHEELDSTLASTFDVRDK